MIIYLLQYISRKSDIITDYFNVCDFSHFIVLFIDLAVKGWLEDNNFFGFFCCEDIVLPDGKIVFDF